MTYADTLIHIFALFARGYCCILEVFTKLKLLSWQDIDGYIGGIGRQGERDIPCVMGIAAIQPGRGDSVTARGDIGETEGAGGISRGGPNRGAATGEGDCGSRQRHWRGTIGDRAGQHVAADAEACHGEGDRHRLGAARRSASAIGSCNGNRAWIGAREQVGGRGIDPKRTACASICA